MVDPTSPSTLACQNSPPSIRPSCCLHASVCMPTQSLLVSSHLPTTLELEENISVSLNAGLFNKESLTIADALSKTSAYVLMFDEIKIEEIVRYSAADNHIVVICHEHSHGFGLRYSGAH